MIQFAIEVDQLTKTFESTGWFQHSAEPVTSVDRVSLKIPRGELFGLLGPNGAGKTTLSKMLCTLISPSSGTARVGGYPLTAGAQIRATTGLVVTDERSFYWRLSGRHNMRFFAALHGIYGASADARINELLEMVNLSDVADRPFRQYSSGMKQRMAIARGLLHRPQILFLDEPSRSLDPVATQSLHALIQKMHADGMTIFLITHDLGEAEKLCQRVAVMHAGRIQTIGAPADLRRRLQQRWRYHVFVTIRSAEQVAELNELKQTFPDIKLTPSVGDRYQIGFSALEDEGRLQPLLAWLNDRGFEILSIDGAPPSLEEVFAHFVPA